MCFLFIQALTKTSNFFYILEFRLSQSAIENLSRILDHESPMNNQTSCNASLASQSSDQSSIGAATSSSSIGSTSEVSYVDLDKVFVFLNDIARDKVSTDDINKQFDIIIESAKANANQLENLMINLNNNNIPEDDKKLELLKAPASHEIHDQNKLVQRSFPVPPPVLPKPNACEKGATNHLLQNNANRQQQIYGSISEKFKPPLPPQLAINGYGPSSLPNNVNYYFQQQQQHQQQFQQNGNFAKNNYNNNSNNNNNNHLTDRRKQRVDRKVTQLQEQQLKDSEKSRQSMVESTGTDDSENAGLRIHDIVEFANKYFNTHPRDFNTGTSVIRTLTRRKKSNEDDCLTKQEMLLWTPTNAIPASHIHMHDPENTLLACQVFKDICKYMSNVKSETEIKLIQAIVGRGIQREALRDEIFVQLIRQSTNNPSREETLKIWVLIGLTSAAFQPSKVFSKYFHSFLRKSLRKDSAISCYAQFSLDNLHPKSSVQASRRLPPSSMEINAVKTLGSLLCRFHFLDRRTKAIDIHPCDTAQDAMMCLASKIGLKNLDGWAIYEQTPDYEKV